MWVLLLTRLVIYFTVLVRYKGLRPFFGYSYVTALSCLTLVEGHRRLQQSHQCTRALALHLVKEECGYVFEGIVINTAFEVVVGYAK